MGRGKGSGRGSAEVLEFDERIEQEMSCAVAPGVGELEPDAAVVSPTELRAGHSIPPW